MKFEQISHIVLVFTSLNLNKYVSAGTLEQLLLAVKFTSFKKLQWITSKLYTSKFILFFVAKHCAKFPEHRVKRFSDRPTANEQTERWSYKLTILRDSRWQLICKILKVKLHLILNFAQTPENIYLLWKNGLVVRTLIPNSKIVRSKPLGGSKVDSAFHTSKVHQMSTTTTSRGHSGKK